MHLQYWCGRQRFFQPSERLFAFRRPFYLFLLTLGSGGSIMQRGCYMRKVLNESTIIGCHSQERSYSCDRSWSWPILDCFDFLLVNLDSILGHYMSYVL